MLGTVDSIDYDGDRVRQVVLRFPGPRSGDAAIVKEVRACERIGQGSFGTVYRAICDGYPRLALKISTGKSSRLRQELEVLSRVCTQGRLLLPRFEFGALNKSADLIVIGMELCVPSTLHDLLLSTRITSEAEMLFMAHQVVQAVAYVHENGCIHRDIKLQNFVFDLDGNLKLIDFGLACSSLSPPAGDVVAGTVSFMSPEMAHNALHKERRVSVGVAADVWSLGIVLFSIFTQRNPYPTLESTATQSGGSGASSHEREESSNRNGGTTRCGGKGGKEDDTVKVQQRMNERLLRRVAAGDWQWPVGVTVSPDLKLLVNSILVTNPEQRPSVATILQKKLWNLRRRYPPAAVAAFLGVQDDLLLSHDEAHLMRAVEERSAGVTASLLQSRLNSPDSATSSSVDLTSDQMKPGKEMNKPQSTSRKDRTREAETQSSSAAGANDALNGTTTPPLRPSLKVVQRGGEGEGVDGAVDVQVYDVRASTRKRSKPIREISVVMAEENAKSRRGKSARGGRNQRANAASAPASRASSDHRRAIEEKDDEEVKKANEERPRRRASSAGASLRLFDAATSSTGASGSAAAAAATALEDLEAEDAVSGVHASRAAREGVPLLGVSQEKDDKPRVEVTDVDGAEDGISSDAVEASTGTAAPPRPPALGKPHSRASSLELVGGEAARGDAAIGAVKKVKQGGPKSMGVKPASNGRAVSSKPRLTSVSAPANRDPPAEEDEVLAEKKTIMLPTRTTASRSRSIGRTTTQNKKAGPASATSTTTTTAPAPLTRAQRTALELSLSVVYQDEADHRRFLSSALFLEHVWLLASFRLTIEEDQERYGVTWLAEEQEKSAAHPHRFKEMTQVTSRKYQYGFVCDLCDYEFLPTGKKEKDLHFFHCPCGRDLCPECFMEYQHQCTCACCHSVHPNSCVLREHLQRTGGSQLHPRGEKSALAPKAAYLGDEEKREEKEESEESTPPRAGRGGRARAGKSLTKNKKTSAATATAVNGKTGKGGVSGTRAAKDIGRRRRGARKEEDEEEGESQTAMRIDSAAEVERIHLPRMSIAAMAQERHTRGRRRETAVAEGFTTPSTPTAAAAAQTVVAAVAAVQQRPVEKIPEGPWRPFARLQKDRRAEAARQPTPEEREALLGGDWIRYFYLFPSAEQLAATGADGAAEDPYAFVYHAQPGRTGAVFLTSDFPMHSAVFSMLERQFFVVDHVDTAEGADATRATSLLRAKGHPELRIAFEALQDIVAYDTNMMKQQRTPGTVSVYQAPLSAYSCNGEPFLYVRWFRFNEDRTLSAFLLSNGAVQVFVKDEYELRWFDENRKFLVRFNGVCELVEDSTFALTPAINHLLYDTFDV